MPCDVYCADVGVTTGAATTVGISNNTLTGIPQSDTPDSDPTVMAAGIWVGNTDAASALGSTAVTASDNTVTGGYQGILMGPNTSSTVQGNTVSGFAKNGITIGGIQLVNPDAGSPATSVVTGNTVTGSGPTCTIAQNGIEFDNVVTGTVSGNTVSSTDYTGSGWTTTGILLADVSGVTVSGNFVSDKQSAIVLQSFWDVTYSCMAGDTVSDNYISYTSSYGNKSAGTTNGTTGVDVAAYAWGLSNPSVSASIISNDVEGPGDSGSTLVVDSTSTGLQIGVLACTNRPASSTSRRRVTSSRIGLPTSPSSDRLFTRTSSS